MRQQLEEVVRAPIADDAVDLAAVPRLKAGRALPHRIVLSIDSAAFDVILPKLDQWAVKLGQVG